jgi:hypothetical protein
MSSAIKIYEVILYLSCHDSDSFYRLVSLTLAITIELEHEDFHYTIISYFLDLNLSWQRV